MNLSNNKVYLYLIGILSHTIELLITALVIAGCIIATLFEHSQISFTIATIIIVSLTIISLLLLIARKENQL
jgi:hypothetical protein